MIYGNVNVDMNPDGLGAGRIFRPMCRWRALHD